MTKIVAGRFACESLREIAARNFAHVTEFFSASNYLMSALFMVSVVVAALYSLGVSFWDGESVDGWLWNIVAAVVGATQVMLLYVNFMVTVTSGFTVFEWILERTYYARWIRETGHRGYSRPTSSNKEYRRAAVAGSVVGLTVGAVLYYVTFDLVWSIEPLGQRIFHLMPGLREDGD